MGIHQLSIHHDPHQDRLLWRVNTTEGQEFRFWLTRRMVQRLLPALGQSLQTIDVTQVQVVARDPATRQMVSEMRHAQTLQTSDFGTPYTPQTELPLGEAPMLVTDVQLRIGPKSVITLVMQDKSANPSQQCQLQLNSDLLHGCMHLLTQALTAAEWGLALKSQPTGQTAAPQEVGAAPYRH